MKRINIAEWTIAIASVFSGIFVGIQAYLIRMSIDGPIEANRHSFMLESCKSFLSSSANFTSDYNRVTTLSEHLSRLKFKTEENDMGFPAIDGISPSIIRSMTSSLLLPGCDYKMTLEFWGDLDENTAKAFIKRIDSIPICNHVQPESLYALISSLANLEAVTLDEFNNDVKTLMESADGYNYEMSLRGNKKDEILLQTKTVREHCFEAIRRS